MRRARFLTLALLAGLVVAGAVGEARAGNGDPPRQCSGDVEFKSNFTCLVQSHAATFTLAPHEVKVGGTITATLVSTGDFDLVRVNWNTLESTFGTPPGTSCGIKDLGKGAKSSCTFKVLTPTGGWRTAILDFGTTIGPAQSRDYYAASLTATPPPTKTTPKEKPKASISVAVQIGDQLEIGKEADATVIVTAGEVGLSGVHFTGKALKIVDKAVKILDAPKIPSSFSLGAGASRSFVYHVKAVENGSSSLRSSVTGNGPDGPVSASTSREVKVGGSDLQVEIAADPKIPFVVQRVEGPVPQDVHFTVKVTNRGKTPIEGVTLPAELTVGHLSNPYKILEPKPKGRPKPEELRLGTLKPGQTAKAVVYDYVASGDGTKSVEALANGHRANKRVSGLGKLTLLLRTDILVVTARKDKQVPSSDNPGLIQAGTPFSLLVKIENRSYDRKVLLEPNVENPRGNLHGGEWRDHLNAAPLDLFLAQAQEHPSLFLKVLEPQRSVELDLVFASEASSLAFDARAAREDGPQGAKGGTRGEFLVGKPGAVAPPEDDPSADPEDWVEVDPSLIVRSPDKAFVYSFDDSGMTPRAWNKWTDPVVAYGIFSVGTVAGVAYWAWGTVKAIVDDLPALLVNGYTGLPGAWQAFTEYAVALWDSVQHDPTGVAKKAFAAALRQATTITPGSVLCGVLASKCEQLWQAVNDQVANDMSKMSGEWYGGNWQQAAWDAGVGTGGLAADVATLPVIEVKTMEWARAAKLAVLAESPEVVRAFAAAAKLHLAELRRAVTARLASTARLSAKAALETFQVVGDAAKAGVGFLFEDSDFPSLFGLTEENARYLRDFARENKVLFTIRSRATESIEWLNGTFTDGVKAVLKPEEIKTKNVDFDDVEYLGYDQRDMGRVVVKSAKPPTEEELIAKLRSKGLEEGGKEWTSALNRRVTRAEEWEKEAADWKAIREAGDNGVVREWKWNWEGNEVDPRKAPNIKPQKVRIRLRGEPKEAPTRFIVEVKPELTGPWRSVTGDVDAVALTDIDGRPLPDEVYGKLLEKLRTDKANKVRGAIGASHPTTDSWVKNGKIWFEEKAKQLNAGKCCFAQFGPDGQARAVSLNLDLSLFKQPPYTRNNFRFYWDGGLRHPVGYHKLR